MAGGGLRLATFVIRLFEFIFAVILVGIVSYMIDQFRHYGFSPGRVLVVPEVFSVFAIAITIFTIPCALALGFTCQLVSSFLDFVLFVGYLTSSCLLRDNYHVHVWLNPLRNRLIIIRTSNGDIARASRSGGLVRLLSSLVVIQTILFFTTMLLSIFLAKKLDKAKRAIEKTTGGRRGENVPV